MAEPFLGEVRLFAGNFAPVGWHFCDGTLLEISQNDALYALIGTTYGGDGFTTFGLPDLRGRIPVHVSAALPAKATKRRNGQGPRTSAGAPNRAAAKRKTRTAKSTSKR